MPRVDLKLQVDIKRTPRVTQLEGIFDVPRSERSIAEYHFDAPFDEREWQIGLIVGPSGAGKSTVARHLFSEHMRDEYLWDPEKAVTDCFDGLGVRETTEALSSVGFSSPPSWLKPYRVLSNGEKFRCNLARAVCDSMSRVCVDEFTSVVDRTVAKIGSHAVSKAIRRRPGKQFVAVSCHDDIIEWLQPDWVLEPHVGRFEWRSLRRRPEVKMEIVRVSHPAWKWFSQHHYLSASLHKSAKCFMGLINGQPAAFAGLLYFPHPRASDIYNLSRLVVLPDYQGLGIGSGAFSGAMGRIAKANGFRLSAGASHPSLIRVWAKSTDWLMTAAPRLQTPAGATSSISLIQKHAKHRRIASFMWAGSTLEDVALAKKMWL